MGKVIKFNSKEQFIEKLKEYSENLELFFEEYEKAVPLLKKYFKFVDNDLKLKVLLLLGSFAKEASWDFCYEVAMDREEHEMIRDTSALNLGHILKYSNDNEALIETLLIDVNSDQKDKREYAIRALGFEGNYKAALPLVELLFDHDINIQQCAINALSNIKDPSVVKILINQLKNGSREKVMTILFNLWRFGDKKEEILPIYLDYIENTDAELKLYSLALLENISNIDEHLDILATLIKDKDKRIRKLTAEYIGKSNNEGIKPLLSQFLDDEDIEVKRIAVNALKNLSSLD